MNAILISYDLGGPESSSDYQDLITKIKSLGTRCHPLDSFWFVKTNLSSGGVRDFLKPYLDSNDELLCMDVSGDGWGSFRLNASDTDWMQKNL